jgi:hypothetical protein
MAMRMNMHPTRLRLTYKLCGNAYNQMKFVKKQSKQRSMATRVELGVVPIIGRKAEKPELGIRKQAVASDDEPNQGLHLAEAPWLLN